ncbi:MAG: diguanylate cyclase [Roseinatronobacter sp.]|nr:diguanylate cyclase [Roseinatronobacter sp.]
MSGRILVVDDMLLSRMVLRVRLASACYQTLHANSGAEALEMARGLLPDLIVVNYALPDMPAPELCTSLRGDPKTAHIPIIVFSSDGGRELRLRALGAGADDFLCKPIDEQFLLSRIRVLLRHSAAETEYQTQATPMLRLGLAEAAAQFHGPAHVVMVGPRPGHDGTAPQPDAVPCDRVLPLSDLLAALPEGVIPDLLVLSPDVLEQGVLNVIAELRARPATRRMPKLALVGAASRLSAAMLLDIGAEDVMRLPLDIEEFHLRRTALIARKRRYDAMRRALGTELDLAARDPLTGLFNRRYAMSRLSDLVAAQGMAGPGGFGLLMIDLDNFKRVNDNFGHSAGDDVLVELAARIGARIGPTDILARFGGEEFLLILPGGGLAQAHQMAEAIRQQIEERPFVLTQGGYHLSITASIGVTAHHPAESDSYHTVLEQIRKVVDHADQALRLSKAGGRNRVSLGKTAVA